jgi:hypothetical protein
VKNVMLTLKKNSAVVAVLALVLTLCSVTAFATDPVTITDVGNSQGYVEAAIAKLGALAGIILGGFFSFWLVKKVMRWAGKIG